MAEELYKKLGINDFEYSQIKKRLKREPNELEIYLFSAMWSEHCGYKHSKRYLKKLPTTKAVCPQENSGGIKTGSHIIFFKAESHNHPSAVEPFQGAATGIGGIIRDILAVGARPIALLNSLKFGLLTEKRSKYLLDGVVRGISAYGNCIGVPNIGGETNFHECYSSSPIVNVMAAGIVNQNDIKKSSAEKGGIVILLGSYTGRDGIHGASFASKELEDNKEDKLSVQIADPFMKKNVIEASLEILKLKGIISCQDCGAAGLLSSTSEMAYKGNCGIELYLDKVHLRENNMRPWEIMLSESQERMVFIAEPQYINQISKIAEKYNLPISVIGKTTNDKRYKLFLNKKKEADLPHDILNDCITYKLKAIKPDYIEQYKNKKIQETDLKKEDIIKLLKDSNIASKKYIYSQYDYTVGNRTVSRPEKTSCNALWIKEENKFIAFTIDSKPEQTFLNPEKGSIDTVYEASRNLIASGFKPLGITDCLNFGNPEKSDTAYQFINSIKGITKACKKLNIPVVSGNVSFYNENDTSGILPTVTIGMIGESNTNILKNTLKADDYIYLIGKDITDKSNTGGSLYLKIFYDFTGGNVDSIDYKLEEKLSRFILKNKDNLTSCNDVSQGGLFTALFEILYSAKCGFEGNIINIKNAKKALFGEITGRYIISTRNDFKNILRKNNIPYRLLGRCHKNKFKFDYFSFNIKELFDIYENSFKSECEN